MANASVQLITAPWAGYDSPGASALGLMGGGAATPVWHSTGFNWPSIVGFRSGGPIATVITNARGVPMTASFVRRFPGGLRGFGQDSTTTLDYPGMPGSGPFDTGSYTPPDPVIFTPPTSVPAVLSSVLGPVATASGGIAQQYVSYQNPLLQKQTVALSPSGQVLYATNQPSFGTAATTGAAAFGSMLPMLIGLVAVVSVIGIAAKK